LAVNRWKRAIFILVTDNVGQRVRALRIDGGYSQQRLAEYVNRLDPRLNWMQTTVQKLETGNRSLYFDEAIALAAVFAISVDDLAYGRRSPESKALARAELHHAKAELVKMFEESIARIDDQLRDLEREEPGIF
jgi:transcriptional regulator with XRE-family HTH domain